MEQTQQVALPSSMRYSMSNVKAVSAETTLRQFASSNGSSFSPTVNEIRIPVSGHDGFLDVSKSYIYFVVKNLNATLGETLTFDSDGLCWIESIRVESQGVLLERLDQAALWNNLRSRWSKGAIDSMARNSKAGGYQTFYSAKDGEGIAHASSLSVCAQLPLGFMNPAGEKALPAGTQFEIVIRCNSTPASCFKWGAVDKYAFTIETPRFYCPVYRIENREVMSEYAQVLSARGISWVGDCAKTYISSLPTGAGTTSLQINDRSKSLKGFVSAKRLIADITDRAKNSQSETNISGVTQLSYVIEGRHYPQDTIQCSLTDYCRLYDQCEKAMSLQGKPNKPAVKAADFKSGGTQGLMGVDLKKFDDDRLTDTGLNTTGGAPNVLEITTDANHNADSQVTTYAIAECTWTLMPNGVITASI